MGSSCSVSGTGAFSRRMHVRCFPCPCAAPVSRASPHLALIGVESVTGHRHATRPQRCAGTGASCPLIS